MALTEISDIKDAAQMLDTSVVQWLNSGPPESIQKRLTEARELLQRGTELADAPLRIALVGEFNSGKTLLLNSMLDSADLFPCLLQPCTGNVLEVRVHLRKEERAPEIQKATVSFFNQFELENVLDYYIRDLKNQGIDGIPNKIAFHEIEKFEKLLCKKFQDLKAITPKYAIVSALEFLLAVRYNQELVCREQRQVCTLPVDLIPKTLTLTGRMDLNKGIQAIYSSMKSVYEGREKVTEKVTSANLHSVFPVIRRVMVDVSAWNVPFGVDDCKCLAFLDFPGLGAESSSARDHFLCMSEIRDAHAVLVIFNGSNPGGSGASVMATLFQKAGKLTSDRTIVAVNRFDEFHPMPTDRTVETYYSCIEQGTTVGFCNLLIPARNLLSTGREFKMYVCSALCYLFDEKTERPNWNFGDSNWFMDNKRQAAYTLFKRSAEDFKKLIKEVKQGRSMLKEHEIMKTGLENYLVKGGIPILRSDLVHFAIQKGEKLIKEDALKEIRNAHKILDELAPAAQVMGDRGPISPDVTFAAQEFYRVLELAVADTLPNGQSEYKKLKLSGSQGDVQLWDTIEQEIAAQVTSWPEWFAILNQSPSQSAPQSANKPQKRFARYKNLKKQGGTVPTEFGAFDERFRTTAKTLTEYTLQGVGQSMLYSLQRFEEHPDYKDAIQHFQSMVAVDNFSTIDEALPILDVWNPSKLGEEDIVPIVLDRIQEEVEAIENLSYPYDASKPCFWNLALIIRVQVQLMKTYRDRLSRLVAAAESHFQSCYVNEILRAEILPLVRSALNNPDFLGQVATSEGGVSWESVGQVVRAAVENFKNMDGISSPSKLAPKGVTPFKKNEEEEFSDEESEQEVVVEEKPVVKPQPQPQSNKPQPVAKQPVKPTQPSKPASSQKPQPASATTPVAATPVQQAAVPPTPPKQEYAPEILDDGESEAEDDEEFEEW